MSDRVTTHRIHRAASIATAVVMLAALVIGCDKAPASSSSSAAPDEASAAPAAASPEDPSSPPTPPTAVVIGADSVGSLTLGMPRAQVLAVEDLYPVEGSTVGQRDGVEAVALSATKGGFQDVVVEFVEGRAAVIAVEGWTLRPLRAWG